MRNGILFTLLACCSPSPHKQLAQPMRPAAPPADAALPPAPDAPVAPALGQRGDACTSPGSPRAPACSAGLDCVTGLPGGYCASTCGGNACDGICLETRDNELCLERCKSDGDCRTDEGYLCDRKWSACVVPNLGAPTIEACTPAAKATATTATATTAAGRDAAFGASEQLSIDASGRIGAAAVLADDGTPVTRVDARLARDRKNVLYAVSLAATGNAVMLATSSDRGATWSPPVAVHDPTDCADAPRGCIDHANVVAGKGVVYVLYRAGDNGLRVRVSRDGGKTFTTGQLALIGTYGNATVTGDGKLHIVAMAGDALGAYGSAQQRVEYTVTSDGGETFAAPSPVSGNLETLPYFASNPALAVDERRKLIYVAYARGARHDPWQIVLAVSKDGGATWKRKLLTTGSCGFHLVPNLALDAATGTLHVAYYDSEGAPGRFVHATCSIGATTCKVAGAINSTPFAGLSLSRGARKWPGDYASLVVDDKRRLLHATWVQPVDEAGAITPRAFHATAKLKK